MILVLIGFATLVQATILRELSVSELREKSDAIVQARIERIDYQVGPGQIWTILHLRTEKAIRGVSVSSIKVRIPGGQRSVDGRTLVTRVEGVPEFRLQERGIFFLESAPPAYPGILGWSHGYYRILQKNQEEYAVRSDGTQPPVKLQQFLREIEKNFTVEK
jgi:hypothetical protein